MPRKHNHETGEQVFAQSVDASGRTRLDRKLTPEEAAAQDEAHRQHYLEQRAKRFFGPAPEEIVSG